jgi:hypothetical protein
VRIMAYTRPGAALIWAVACASIWQSGCGSGSSTATHGDSPTADGGDVAESAALSDGGPYGACTSKSPADPSPDLNGHWAWRTVASRYVPATGLTSAFYTRTISLLLAEQTQTAGDFNVSAQYCDQDAEDPEALAHVVIPDTFKRSLKPFVRTGSYVASTPPAVLSLPTFTEVVGATLTDPDDDSLPTDPDDPRLVDEDQDGNPGVTIKLSGIVSGDLYVVQRLKSALTGIGVSADRVEGHYGFSSEQVILSSNPASLKALAEQTAIVDPALCASTFTMVRVPAEATCTSVTANATLFE